MADTAYTSAVVEKKCACPSCQCPIVPGKAVERAGKVYCSNACAYDCTETTCVCVHDRCDDDNH